MTEEHSEQLTRRYRIHGRVQGVGYRAFVWRLASSLGLAGWALNRRDGSVEAVLQGPAEALDRARAQLELGPSLARVDQIEVAEQATGNGCHGFEIRPTV